MLLRTSVPLSLRSARRIAAFSLALFSGGALFSMDLQAQGQPDVRVLPQPDGPLVQRHWTVRSGLPVNQITGMIQGEDGYLWLATFDGLVRFDGVRFTLFNKGQSPSIPLSRFSGILGQSDNTIWLVSEADHLIAFRRETFTDHTPDLEGPHQTFHIDPRGGIWAGTTAGLFRMEGDRFIRVPLPEEGGVTAITGGPDGTLWLARSSMTIELFHPAQSVLRAVRLPVTDRDRIDFLTMDGEGAVWGASSWGAVRIHGDEVDLLRLDRPGGLPSSMIPPGPISFGVLSVGADAYRLTEGKWQPLTLRDLEEPSFPSSIGADGGAWSILREKLVRNGSYLSTAEAVVSHLLVDQEGSVWAAGTSGLYQLRRASVDGIALTDRGERYEAYALHQGPSGNIWVTATGPAAGSGLWRLNGRDAQLVVRSPPAALPSRLEMGVLEDRQGGLWVPLVNGGVCRLVNFQCSESAWFPMDGELVRAIVQATDGTLWFGTSRTLRHLRSDGSWVIYGEEQGLPPVLVRAIAETSEGHLWLGTQRGGVFYWDGRNFHQLSQSEGLSTNAVRALYLDPTGALWVGTEGVGVVRVVRSGDAADGSPRWNLSIIRQADGLFDDGVHQILEDSAGRLWMSSNRGLFFVKRADLEDFVRGTRSRIHSVKFDEADGLLDRELNGGVHGAGLVARDGRILFPGMKGLAAVNPNQVEWNHPPPRVRIEGLVVAGRTQLPEGRFGKPADGSRDLEIAFTALSFWAPQAIAFRYRLRGFEEDWRESAGLRRAYYTNLPGGRYQFEVQASGQPGVWNPVSDTLAINVPYRIHEHPAAQAGLGIFLLLGLGGIVRLRERQLRTQARRLEKLVDERTRMVKAQAERLVEMDQLKSRLFEDLSHELRAPLTLIVAPLEGVREGLLHSPDPAVRRDVNLALQNAQRLLDLVGQILDLARLEAGRLPVRVSRLQPEGWIRHQMLAFSPLADRKGVSLRTEIPSELPELWTSPDLFQKMFGNLVSNAIKFTPYSGMVRVKSWADDDHLYVEVRDSGPGIPADRIGTLFQRFSQTWGTREAGTGLPSTRIGLSLVRQLAELHGGGVEVTSVEGFGATFRLKLRLGRAHFPPSVEVDESPTQPTLLPGEPDPARGWADPMARTDGTDMGTPLEDTQHAPEVLVVEDHADVRAYLNELLEGTYRVRTASNGQEAIDEIARAVPDLIVSDLRMPVMDGLALLTAVRGSDEARSDGLTTPFLLVSAHDDAVDRATAYSLGASDYITKPFSPKQLLARIGGLLATQALLEQRRPVLRVSANPTEVESATEGFLVRLAQVVEANLGNADFGTENLARALGYSRSGLYRKLQEVGEESPAQILQRMRLDRAAHLLEEEVGSVSWVASRCGFQTVSHFSRVFKERFGVPPSKYTGPEPTLDARPLPASARPLPANAGTVPAKGESA